MLCLLSSIGCCVNQIEGLCTCVEMGWLTGSSLGAGPTQTQVGKNIRLVVPISQAPASCLSLTPLVQEKWAAEIGVTSEGHPDFVKLVKIVNGSCIPVCSHLLLSLDITSSRLCHSPSLSKTPTARLEHACTRTLSMPVLILYDALIYA